MHGAPAVWNSQIIEEWALARGFTRVRSTERRGRSAWTFQAVPPPSLGVTTFAFSSGISVGPATAHRRKEEIVQTFARARWGVAALPSLDIPSNLSVAVPVRRSLSTSKHPDVGPSLVILDNPGPDVTMASEDDADGPAAQRRRVIIEPFPHHEFFEGIDCGGSGDCGFTCVGRAMYVHRQSQPDCKGHRTCNDEDFLPRGPVQAELRLLAARELANNFRQYLFSHSC